jgi:putative ABC transport system permease protein
VLLPENSSPAGLEKKLAALANYEYLGWYVEKMKFRLQPITDIHLRSHFDSEIEANSDMRYVHVFSVIATIILLIACINYMNMATTRSAHRAKEVGVRKVAGSVRLNLITQFLGESILLSGLAVALALILVELALPAFNNLVQKQLGRHYSTSTQLYSQ